MVQPGDGGNAEEQHGRAGYLRRWLYLRREAWLYLLHAALLTGSLAIGSLIFNLAIVGLAFAPVVLFGVALPFLGVLNSVAVATAAVVSVPLWWLVGRVGLRQALLASAVLQALNAFVLAWWPTPLLLLLGSALTGVAAVLFQVSSAPFMMEQSDDTTRDHLFSANTGINIGIAGLGSLVGGSLPGVFGRWLGVGGESVLAYQATFGVAGVGMLVAVGPLLLIKKHTAHSAQRTAQSAHQEARTENQEPSTENQEPGTKHREPLAANQGESSGDGAVWRGLVRRPGRVLRLLVAPFLISCGAALLIPYLNLFFKARFGVGDEVLGVIFAGLGLTTGVAALVGPVVSVRIGKIQTIVLIQALSLPFLVLLGFVPILAVAVVAALARAALFNMASPLYDAFAMERTEEPLRPAVIGMINGAFSLGYIAGPLISTAVQEQYGFTPLFVATLVCYTLAMSANYWLFVRPIPNTGEQ